RQLDVLDLPRRRQRVAEQGDAEAAGADHRRGAAGDGQAGAIDQLRLVAGTAAGRDVQVLAVDRHPLLDAAGDREGELVGGAIGGRGRRGGRAVRSPGVEHQGAAEVVRAGVLDV